MKEFNNITDCVRMKNHYYMLKNKKSIEIYDAELNYIKEIEMDKEYTSLTYIEGDNNFYLSPVNNNQILHKSSDFKCFKPIKLKMPINCLEEIIHLSYCKCFNSIIITTKFCVFMFDLCKKKIKVIYETDEIKYQINDCKGPLSCSADSKVLLIGALCCCKDIYVAYRFGQKSYISKVVDGKLDEIVYKTDEIITSIFTINNEIWILVMKNCHQELINTHIECSCECNCYKDCKCQIIESIALIEKSIAHILNSEGMKIQAAIKKTDDINDLICINSSVKDVIYYITMLEFILVEKLKTVSCNKDCETECDYDCK